MDQGQINGFAKRLKKVTKYRRKAKVVKGREKRDKAFELLFLLLEKLWLLFVNLFPGTEVNLDKAGHVAVEDEFQTVKAGGITAAGTANSKGAK